MNKANENKAFETNDERLKDRKLFVRNLGELLSQTKSRIVSAKLDDNDIVTVRFANGYCKKICVECDSYKDIVWAVINMI